jgi:Mg2+/Co2+ transporter CorB
LTNIIGWFAKILTSIGNLITRTNSSENYFSQNLNRDELKSVLQKDTEQVDEDEMIALKSLLELNELTVEDILIPIQEVISININDENKKISLKKISFSLYLMKLLRIFLGSYTLRRLINYKL